MASDTATKNSKTKEPAKGRWFRLAPVRPDLPELDNIMDLYWGGPERRITGITLRIIGVNAIALLILMLGFLYTGQYQNALIEARLETFETELKLISASLTDSASRSQGAEFTELSQMAERFALTTRQRIQLFDEAGVLKTDTRDITTANTPSAAKKEFESVQILKKMARIMVGFLPEGRELPPYPETKTTDYTTYPNLENALNREISVSVWSNQDGRILLSAAAPILANNEVTGAVLLTQESTKIEEDINQLVSDVFKIFLVTLVLTTLLSIYLSGVIARPLKKLARSAEAVRTGHARADEIPDLSHRHDEIGELSVVLRQMTSALWERMDSIERFAADVAHELKNPLTSMRSAVETVMNVKKTTDRKKLLDIIAHDVNRLDRLITDISHASRIDTEMSREAFEKIDLKEMLSNLLDIYEEDPLKRSAEKTSSWSKTVKAKNAILTMSSLEDEPIYIWGLEDRLAQVLQNLLSNALSFSPKNGEVDVRIVPLKNKVSIVVEDEGVGVPENKLEKIFERFYSERPHHEDYGQHSGLGLSICRQIIDAHSGKIFAENIIDENGKIQGARFTVILNKAQD